MARVKQLSPGHLLNFVPVDDLPVYRPELHRLASDPKTARQCADEDAKHQIGCRIDFQPRKKGSGQHEVNVSPGAPAKGDRQGEKAATEAAQKEAKARKGPSEDFQESIRRTVERRRERRARRGQGTSRSVAPGAIVPWLMAPALIIRQT
jgi:hypothetical protein